MNVRARFFACVIAVVLAPLPGRSATPRDELLRLVPGDAAVVVVVSDLRSHADQITASPLLARLRETAVGRRILASREWRQLADVNAVLQREVGASATELRNDILGDAFVFVWRPGPPERPDADDSLFLVRPRDPAVAERALAHINRAQGKAGRRSERRSHAGREYFRRARSGEPDELQYSHDGVFAFGSGEKLLHDVIAAQTRPAEAEAPAVAQLRRLGLESAAAALWFNPRAIDQQFAAARPRNENSPEAVTFAALYRHWQAIDGIAAYVSFGDDARLGMVFTADPDALPASTRRLLRAFAQPSEALAYVAPDVLVLLAGRLDLAAVHAVVTEFLPSAVRDQLADAVRKTVGASLGSDTLARLPEHLGPDWAVWLAGPAATDSAPTPIATLAVRLGDGGEAQVGARVMDGLTAAATFAVVGYNTSHAETIELTTERRGDVTIRAVRGERVFPDGVRPCYAWKHGFLLIASHPVAVERFRSGESALSGTPVVAYVAPPAWRDFLRQRRAEFVRFLAAQARISARDAERRLDEVDEVLALFTRLDVAVRTEPKRARLEMTVTPAVPLR